MKKLIALMIALAMLSVMLPCIALADDAIDTSKHVVITYMVTGDKPTNKTDEVLGKINEILTEKVNAELQIKWIEWTNWTTNYNLALATQSGDIDLVGTATDWLDAWPNTQKGAFLALSEDMLKTYAPQTWAAVPQEHWDLCKYDGSIYLIPEDQYAQWTNHGFMYRGDWAKEAGLENGVNSWEELGTYLQYVKDNKEGVIPWDADGFGSSYSQQMAGGWQTSHTTNVYIEGLGVDLFYGESAENPYKLSNYYLEGDELVNFAKTMKAWADAGYWRSDVLNYSGDQAQEMKEGLSAARQHHTETWTGFRTEMEKAQPGSDLGFFWFGEEMGNLVSLNITHGAMAVAATSKNPERALMFLNLLNTDPTLMTLMNYGVEGVNYTTNSDGTISFVDETHGGYMPWRNGMGNIRILPPTKEEGLTYWDDFSAYYNSAETLPYGGFIFDNSPVKTEGGALANVYAEYAFNLMSGAVNPDTALPEFLSKMEAAGIDAFVAEANSQLNAYLGK